MARDDFTPATKRALALRVAHQCSFPSCPIITVGPDSASSDAVAQVGEAAHISAASPGGARYDASMTPKLRSHIDNGIWLCGHHATLIDQDADSYPPDLLVSWKKEAEERAALRQQHPGLIPRDHPNGDSASSVVMTHALELVQQALQKIQNPANDLRTFSLASFVQQKYPHSNAILTVNAETGGTKIQFSKPQTVKLALPSNSTFALQNVVSEISQGRSVTMDWSDLNISVDASDPVLNEAFAPGRGKQLKFIPHPINDNALLFFRIGRNEPLPVKCEYTITPDDGPVIIRPIVSTAALKFEWVLEKHILQVNYHLVAKTLASASFQFSDLPLLKLLRQLGTTSGKFSIAIGEKSKIFAEVQWKHRSSDKIALWSNLAALLVEASTILRLRGLIDEDLPWPNSNEKLPGLLSQLQLILNVLNKQKHRQAWTQTISLYPNNASESWNIQLNERKMHAELTSDFVINGQPLLRQQVDMNPATVRFFNNDQEIFAESIGAAMGQCSDRLTVELTCPNAKLTYLRTDD